MNLHLNKKLSIVIPLHNEEGSIKNLYSQIIYALEKLDFLYEIIFIDDGSTDDSFKILLELKTRDQNIKIINLRRNFGKSIALSVGFEKAQGDFIFTMDADLQDDPSEIPNFLEKMKNGDYDLISGWKKNRKDPLIKIISSKIFNFTISVITGIKIHDFNCGYKLYRKEVIKNLEIYGELHRFLPVLAHQKGFKVGEISVLHHERKFGKSKYGKFGLRRIKNYLLDPINIILITKYSKKPAHFFGNLGLLSFSLGLLFCAYLTIIWLLGRGPIGNRPLLFLGILLIIVGIQLISLGLLGEIIIKEGKQKNLNDYIKKEY